MRALEEQATPTAAARATVPGSHAVVRDLRALAGAATAGLVVGFVINGLGSRLAMRILFMLNPDVRGRLSDDGFIMGRFDLLDTLSLVAFGTAVGIASALVYLLVRGLRFGPPWFHHTAMVVGPTVVAAQMLIHSDGIDFRVLRPTSVAVGLFILLPALSAVGIIWLVERWIAPGAWAMRTDRAWLLGVVPSFVLGPFLVAAAAVLGVRAGLRTASPETAGVATAVIHVVGRLVLTAVFAISAYRLGVTISELLR